MVLLCVLYGPFPSPGMVSWMCSSLFSVPRLCLCLGLGLAFVVGSRSCTGHFRASCFRAARYRASRLRTNYPLAGRGRARLLDRDVAAGEESTCNIVCDISLLPSMDQVKIIL